MIRRLVSRVRGLVGRRQAERELDQELRFHLEMETEANVARGMTQSEARRAALIALGGLDQTTLAVRDVRAGWWDALSQDVRIAGRGLRRTPGFTVVAILTLALVIGASTAIFSALYGLVFRPLPYRDADRLVMLWESNRDTGQQHMPLMSGAFPIIERQARDLSLMAAYTPPIPRTAMFAPKVWATERRVSVGSCTHQFLAVLGAAPVAGRSFVRQDSTRGSQPVAMLSYEFWRAEYRGGDVIGKTLSLNEFGERNDYTIVGVMPRAVEFPFPVVAQKPDVWVDLRYDAGAPFLPGHLLNVVARLADGVSLQQAQTEIETIARRIEADHRKYFGGERVSVVSLDSELIRHVRTVLWVLLAAMATLSFIGCTNIGHLLLVRAIGQTRDMALRAALGAGRWALARYVLAETTLLALCGGILGVALAYSSMRGFLALLPPSLYIPRFSVVALDVRLLAAAATIAIGTSVCFGLLPSARLLRPDLTRLMKTGTGSVRRRSSVFRRPGSILLISQVCLTLVMLTGTVGLARSLRTLLQVNTRFQPERLVAVNVSFSNAAVRSLPDFDEVQVRRFAEFNERVAAMPGVRAVAAADSFPLAKDLNSFKADGGGGAIAATYQPAEMHIVSPNFLELMSAAVVRGRWLAESDSRQSQPVAVVNDAMVRQAWAGHDPIGRRISPFSRKTDAKVAYLVVGVVKEAERLGNGEPPQAAVYLSLAQVPLGYRSVVVRTAGDARPLAGMLREAALQILSGQMFVGEARTGADFVSDASARLHVASMLLSALSAVALLLSVVGIYGLLVYFTTQRTHEMGIRLAVGATRGQILRLVLKEGMLLALTGVVAGTGIAAACAGSLASLLYGHSAVAPTTFAGTAAFLLAVAGVACYLPARRAANVDPIVALRID